MTEQKTPLEPKQPTGGQPGQGRSWREKLRQKVAEWQCSALLLRHRLSKGSRKRGHASLRRMRSWPAYRLLGDVLYTIGFQGEYAAVRSWRQLCRAARAAGMLARRAGRTLAGLAWQVGRSLWADILLPVVVFFRGIFHALRHADQVRREKGVLRAAWEALCYLGRGIRLYARLLPRLGAYILPLAVGAACLLYVKNYLDVNYVLAVQVSNENIGVQTVGYVASESVFENAKADVNERINYAGTENNGWHIESSYTLATVADMDAVLDENQMADAILQSSSDEIAEGTALYLDGALSQVTADGDRLRSYLDGLMQPYQTDDPNTTVRFNHAVELVDGIFFTESFTDYDDIVHYLSADEIQEQSYTVVAGDSISLIASKNGLTTGELYNLNPGLTADTALYPGDQLVVQKQVAVLEVQIDRVETYTEAIPYDTVTTESSDYNWGTTKVLVEGQDGVRSVTAQTTYDTEGNVLETVILSRETVQEPVTREVVKGTKTAMGTVAAYGSGNFMWPVPGYKYCSRWMSSGHKGVDICAGYGTAILASDAGVVVSAGYNAAGSGYGYSIIIDHGNGYRTLYAHCSALYVSTGQSVSQGQVIGAVGSTGRSTGNHCHFEIIYNGSRVAPQNVFGGYR